MNSRPTMALLLAVFVAVNIGDGLRQVVSAQDNQSSASAIDPSITTSPVNPNETQAAADTTANNRFDNLGLVALGSILIAGFTIAIGSIGPALGEGRAVAQALSAIAQQPDSSNTITRTLFVGLAMIESTAIYCFVVAMILLFANPFWKHFIQ